MNLRTKLLIFLWYVSNSWAEPETRKIVGLEIKTGTLAWAGTNDRITLSICDNESTCCYMNDVDDPNVDDHEPGHIDVYTDTELRGCNQFHLKSIFKIVAEISGSDGWNPEWFKIEMDDFVYFECDNLSGAWVDDGIPTEFRNCKGPDEIGQKFE